MNVCRKTTILFLMILLITFTVIPSINASKVISVNNIFTDDTQGPDDAPVTSLFFDEDTGYVTLVAVDYPLLKNCGVKATYYKIDSGETQTYEEPFKLPEGLHFVTFWSEDKCDPPNVEAQKSKQLMCDTEPPTVSIVSPQDGWLYLFGIPIFERPFRDTTICIGQVPVEVYADDKEGYGVSKVFFSYTDGETSYDDSSSDGWRDIYSNMNFGNLTISVSAMDKKGLISEPVSITILVYGFGFF